MVTVDRRYRTVQLSLAVTFSLMEELLGLQLTAALPVFWPTGERWRSRGAGGGQARAEEPLAAALRSLCPLVISARAFAESITE